MKHDGPFRIPAPLTAAEKVSRAAVFKASQEPSGLLTAAVSSEMVDEATAPVVDTAAVESTDECEYGPHAARILRDCCRDVALAPQDKKRSVFEEVAKKMDKAVAGQWLPKAVMMDRLQGIAETQGSFGMSPDQIQQLIADAAEAIPTPGLPRCRRRWCVA
jgi:hypothetical protein